MQQRLRLYNTRNMEMASLCRRSGPQAKRCRGLFFAGSVLNKQKAKSASATGSKRTKGLP